MAQTTTLTGLQVSYDDDKTTSIERNLSALIESMRAGSSAIQIGFHVSRPLHVLGSLIKIQGVLADDVTRHIIFTATIQLQSSSDPKVSDLVEAVGRAGQNYLGRPKTAYHVLLPLNVEQRQLSEFDAYSVGGTKLLCSTWENIQSKYAIDRLITEIRQYIGEGTIEDLWNWSGTPLIVEIEARNAVDAFELAESPFDLLRAAFNLKHDRNPIQFERPEPLGIVLPPVGYGVFLSNGTFENAFVNVEHLAFQKRMTSKVAPRAVAELLSQLSSYTQGKHDTAMIFVQALKMYGRALEATNWQDSYLVLWQTLEHITFDRSAKYKSSEVAERANVLLGNDETMMDFLSVCAEGRNNLVHKGQFSLCARIGLDTPRL